MNKKDVTIIIFGGTGDLAKRKLVPTLSALIAEGTLTGNSRIVGVAREDLDDYSYKQFLVDSTSKNEEKRYLSEAHIFYIRGDSSKKDCFLRLKQLLKEIEPLEGNDRIYYFAISSKLLPKSIRLMKGINLNEENGKDKKIVLEKPLGLNWKSSRKIETEASTLFGDNKIFRIDHYLGKEIIQNTIILKLANPFFDSILNNELIEKIDINLDEDLGVENRIKIYNETGAIKDIIQNHLLQTLSLILMDIPTRLTDENVRKEKIKVLKKLRLLPSEDHLLGQYKDYKTEAERYGIKETKTETFAKITLNCKTKRWDGVKISIRTGKKLEKKHAKIEITFRKTKNHVEHNLENIQNNKLTIDIQPKEDLSISLNIKKPYTHNELENVKFRLSKELSYDPNPSEGHVKLIRDIITGEGLSPVSYEESKAAWKIIEKIEKIKDRIDFVFYDQHTNPEDLLSKKFS